MFRRNKDATTHSSIFAKPLVLFLDGQDVFPVKVESRSNI